MFDRNNIQRLKPSMFGDFKNYENYVPNRYSEFIAREFIHPENMQVAIRLSDNKVVGKELDRLV